MSIYHNPPEEIEKIGREANSQNYHTAVMGISSNECLYALCDNFIYKFAVDVTDPDEFNHFRKLYTSGFLASFNVFVVQKARL